MKTRLSEIENEIDRLLAAQSDWTPLARTLAAEVDARDEVIGRLLAMLRDSADNECYCEDDDEHPIEVCERHELYARAAAIAEGRTE